MVSLLDHVEKLKTQFQADLEVVSKEPQVSATENLRIKWLGRKSEFMQLLGQMATVDKSERPKLGKALNLFRRDIETSLADLREKAKIFAIREKLSSPPLDISLPVKEAKSGGALHPVTLMQNRLLSIFRRYGFSVYSAPEIETDYYNFSALNIPESHPARDMQDTFFVKNSKDTVLRTHTSNTQIHAMLSHKPPLRFVAPGKVYRVDSDATHTPMFHQIECVVVDEGISFAHLKGIIQTFTAELFGSGSKTRFRPSFFPFVEPGAEIDAQCFFCKGSGCKVCKKTGWLEIGGCGMIHPNVFEACGVDSEKYTGFAFGFGIDRMAMLYYGFHDLRILFEGDVSFQSQFSVYS